MAAWRGFASDNNGGVHPDVLAAISAANAGHAHAYGDDPWTERAVEVVRRQVGGDPKVALVWNGTGANVVSLSVLCRPWESVVCAESAHINTDECGAPEHIANVKLIPVVTPDGKLTPDLVRPCLVHFGEEHRVQPKVISVSQATEFGTVYTPEELRALADLAHENGMFLHVDGARLPNAAIGLGCSLRDITSEAGIDALSFGGTKNGLICGEAVVLFGDAGTSDVGYVRKQSGQLASKMRYNAAQLVAMFEGDLWERCARNANEMAQRLANGAAEKGVRIVQPVQANEVFAELADDAIARLQRSFYFYVWEEHSSEGGSVVRWVTSWDTTEADVDALISAL